MAVPAMMWDVLVRCGISAFSTVGAVEWLSLGQKEKLAVFFYCCQGRAPR